jgi:prepilin-type N-terminal cleavage/methylation domain-containing protein
MKRPGFTLLEILLALALMVVVLGLLGMAVDVHVRVADASRNAVEETQSVRLLLRQITDDLHGAIPVTQAPSSFGCLQGNSRELQIDVSHMPLLDETQSSTLFPGNALPACPPSDVRTVTYFVAKPGDVYLSETSDAQEPIHGLLRREWERASFAWAVQGGQTDNLNLSLKMLSPEVEAIEFTYLDGGTTYQEWDSLQQGKLPAAVKISVSIRQPWRKPQSLSAEGTAEQMPSTVYTALVDLPNAHSTLAQAMAADSAQTAAASQETQGTQETQETKSPDSAKQGTSPQGTGTPGIKPPGSGGMGR